MGNIFRTQDFVAGSANIERSQLNPTTSGTLQVWGDGTNVNKWIAAFVGSGAVPIDVTGSIDSNQSNSIAVFGINEATVAAVDTNTNVQGGFRSRGDFVEMGSFSQHLLAFCSYAAADPAMTIDPCGNVGIGIGTGASSYRLDIAGNTLRLRDPRKITSKTTTAAQGEISWTGSAGEKWLYIATGTDSWGRTRLDWDGGVNSVENLTGSIDLVGQGTITVSGYGTNTIRISGAASASSDTASNLDGGNGGSGVFASKVGGDFQFRSLVAGTDIQITGSSTELFFNFTGAGAHPDITPGSNIYQNNSNGTVIQDLTVWMDDDGHVTGTSAGIIDLDGRYYTETEVDTISGNLQAEIDKNKRGRISLFLDGGGSGLLTGVRSNYMAVEEDQTITGWTMFSHSDGSRTAEKQATGTVTIYIQKSSYSDPYSRSTVLSMAMVSGTGRAFSNSESAAISAADNIFGWVSGTDTGVNILDITLLTQK